MPSPNETYVVDRLSHVDQQIEAIVRDAVTAETRKKLLEALRRIVLLLRTTPLDWGDPEYNTKKEGGVACHGILLPFIVHFVVFETEKAVVIRDVRLLT